MAMTAGTVSVNPGTAVVTKNGFAEERYDEMWADYVADLAVFDELPPTDIPTLVAVRTGFAKAANGLAAIISYIQANAETSSDAETIL